MNTRLLTKKDLASRHPALAARPYRLDWLVRNRLIPFVRVGRNVYFDEAEILRWIQESKVSMQSN